MSKNEEEVKFCEIHKVWYISSAPCKSCKQDRQDKQEKQNKEAVK